LENNKRRRRRTSTRAIRKKKRSLNLSDADLIFLVSLLGGGHSSSQPTGALAGTYSFQTSGFISSFWVGVQQRSITVGNRCDPPIQSTDSIPKSNQKIGAPLAVPLIIVSSIIIKTLLIRFQ
jgi:hypothetical protein